MILLYIRFPDTRTINPKSWTNMAPTFVNYHLKFGWFVPKVTVMIKPKIQIITVRATYVIDLAKALTYFVTVTPHTLNVKIEKIPRMKNTNITAFCPISWK